MYWSDLNGWDWMLWPGARPILICTLCAHLQNTTAVYYWSSRNLVSGATPKPEVIIFWRFSLELRAYLNKPQATKSCSAPPHPSRNQIIATWSQILWYFWDELHQTQLRSRYKVSSEHLSVRDFGLNQQSNMLAKRLSIRAYALYSNHQKGFIALAYKSYLGTEFNISTYPEISCHPSLVS